MYSLAQCCRGCAVVSVCCLLCAPHMLCRAYLLFVLHSAAVQAVSDAHHSMQVAASERERELKQQLKQEADKAAAFRNALHALVQRTNSAVLVLDGLLPHLTPEQQQLVKGQNYELALAVRKAQQELAGPAAAPPAAATPAGAAADALEGAAAAGAEAEGGTETGTDAGEAAGTETGAVAGAVAGAEVGAEAGAEVALQVAAPLAGGVAAAEAEAGAALGLASTLEVAAAPAAVAAAAAKQGPLGPDVLQLATAQQEVEQGSMLCSREDYPQQRRSSAGSPHGSSGSSCKYQKAAVDLDEPEVQSQLLALCALIKPAEGCMQAFELPTKAERETAGGFQQWLQTHCRLLQQLRVPDHQLRGLRVLCQLTALRSLTIHSKYRL
jgi:hypothetical protein